MLVVLVVLLAVLALVLIMLLFQTRAALASARDAASAAEQQRDRVADRAAHLEADIERLETELAASHAEVEELERMRADVSAKADDADERARRLAAEMAEAAEARAALEASLTETTDALEAAQTSAAEQAEAVEASAAEVLELTHQNERLQGELVEAADEAARRRTPTVPSVLVTDDGAGLDVSGFSPEMAWQLELVRSERTWRYSVAANPVEDPSPFEGAENPLRLAIEIEALALREDVGAFIGIDWQAGTAIHPTDDPARAHLTLRLAQELLAAAARELSPSTLVVRPDPDRGGVSLEVVASDPDDVDFKIPPPPIASEWIDIDEHGGMVVTVKVDDAPTTGPA